MFQGLFGSVMIPQGMALVEIVFPPEHLRKAPMPFGPIMGVAMVAGPILAGWLLHIDLFGSQWRLIFLINVPFGVVAAVLAWWVMPRHSGEDRADCLGFAVARQLADQGYHMILAARDVSRAEPLAEQLRQSGHEATALRITTGLDLGASLRAPAR